MKTKHLVMLAIVGLVVMITLAGCKKKEPKAATMEEMASKGAATVEEAKTAEIMAASMEQTTCPIMDGNKIDKSVFVEYKGKKVYFCCAGCKEKFEEEPGKYIAKLPQFKQ